MGLFVDVMRSSGPSCTNGPTAVFERVLVTNVDGPVEGHDAPLMELVPGNLPGHVKLIQIGRRNRQTMFGGNFAFSSDSRWRRAVEQIAGGPQSGAVPIHDREEF